MRLLIPLLVVATLLATGTASAVEVHGDDAGDRYVGTGGLVLPGTVDTGTRRRVATCTDCRWRMATPCADAADPGVEAACLSVTRGCTGGAQLLRTWFSEDGGVTWRDLGLFCIPPSGPVRVADVERVMQDGFEELLPSGSITAQPPAGVLPYLPVIFDSGQPATLPPSRHRVGGLDVVLVPRATWHWDFGDGAALVTDRPGSRYPDTAVSHTYRAAGLHLVRLTTVWEASFVIEDLGPFTVRETVVQHAQAPIRVGQARAVLVP